VLATAAVVAASASAAQFTAAKYPVTITGNQSTAHKFTIGGSSVTCTTTTFTGTASGPSATQTMTPTYSGCTAFGFINAQVTINGCDMLVDASGHLKLVCPADKDIEIHGGPCTTTIHPANNGTLKTNTFTNNTPAAGQITLDTAVNNLHATVTSGFGCPVAGGTYANATYTGTTVLKGTSGGVATAITHDP
jgi:hypothetical protein